MFADSMIQLGKKRSAIRETFEAGNARAAEIGRENVFDFSLGNPNVNPPEVLNSAIIKLVNDCNPNKLHGYTSAQGDADVRKTIAESICAKYNVNIGADKIYMTCGAAASLTISINALCRPQDGDEFIIFAPYFPEYKVFIEAAGGKVVVVPPTEPDFQIDFSYFKKALSNKTKAVIINSPNNPSGAVYSRQTLKELADILNAFNMENDTTIYLISDEPYREIVYGNEEIPYVMNFYSNTLVCYSFSKSLSIPGERIGYIAVCPQATDADTLYFAICGAGRALGYVCAPSLFQHVIADCINAVSDLRVYENNRNMLYNALTEYGYTCVKPQGAFYLFVKSPIADANEFCRQARKHELFLVSGDDFGCEGYIRIAYCVKTEQIERSLPAFKALIEDYKE